MLCEECHQNEAVYTISVMMGEAMTQRHLCADCMAKMNMNIASGNMQKLLGAILNAINRGEQPEEGEKVPDDQPDITCPRCRMTLSKFIKTGRLGCPDCYQAFAAQLHPMLLQIHGRVQHAGRKPLQSETDQRSRYEQEELTRQLQLAVNAEDYAHAAEIRDRLRALRGKEEACCNRILCCPPAFGWREIMRICPLTSPANRNRRKPASCARLAHCVKRDWRSSTTCSACAT